MAYKNIVFVKLEKRLLNDWRWCLMSDHAQLLYIKLILLAAETYNKIPKNDEVLREAVRSRLDLDEFKKCLSEIKINFPKFKYNKHFYYFCEFENKTNYLPPQQSLSNRPAIAQQGADKEEEEEEEEEEKEKYAECVSMTKIEYEKLTTKYGKDFTIKCIEKLDNYKGSNGKKYKSDYRTILNWVVDEIKKNNIQQKFNKDPLAGIK